MPETSIKKSIFTKIRNNFIAGVVVLIPIGITLYLTLFIIRISSKVIFAETFAVGRGVIDINVTSDASREIINVGNEILRNL